jgi:pimeloyl-ACP methyl ester carboxylesterase
MSEEVTIIAKDGCELRGLFFRTLNDRNEVAPTYLLQHGMGVDLDSWKFFYPYLLASGFSVLMMDLRGHGLSGDTSLYRCTIGQMADDLELVCRELQVQPHALVGHSFGCQVLLEVLKRHEWMRGIKHFIAVAPAWGAGDVTWSQRRQQAVSVFHFLRRMGKHAGYSMKRKRRRHDHTVFAGHIDGSREHFISNVRALSWLNFAWFIIILQFKVLFRKECWQALGDLPVTLVQANFDRIWSHQNVRQIHKLTAWPLYSIDMQHISISTGPSAGELLADLLRKHGFIGF